MTQKAASSLGDRAREGWGNIVTSRWVRAAFGIERLESVLPVLAMARIGLALLLPHVGVPTGWSGVWTFGVAFVAFALVPFELGSGYGSTSLVTAAAGQRVDGGLGVLPTRDRIALGAVVMALAAPFVVAWATMPGSARAVEAIAWVFVVLAAFGVYARGGVVLRRRARSSIRSRRRRRGAS